jgi:putative DNA primase/helicase
VFVGAANAGKSTLLNVAQDILLGSENVSNIPWQALGDRFNKAELFGKLANVFADLPNKAIDDGGMFKSLTGEDSISAERKNKDPFSFRPYARLLFSCNDIPKNYADRSDGFYRRLTIIRFDKSVPQDKRDPNLRERIAAEADGILTWALDGLKRLIANNYTFSETERTIRLTAGTERLII